jgi:dGTPase
MSSTGGFEANAQNLRVIGELEEKYSDCSGLDLTRAVMDAGFKYKQEFTPSLRKHFYYASDKNAEWILSVGGNVQSFECEIVDLADDIAYAAHDFEDGIKAGLVTESRANVLRDEILLEAQGINDNITTADVDWARDQILDVTQPKAGVSRNVAAKTKTSDLTGQFIGGARRAERPLPPTSSTERYKYTVEVDATTRLRIDALRGLTFRLLISDQRVSTLEARAETILSSLFRFYIKENSLNAYPDGPRAAFHAAQERGVDSEKAIARVACDYISGMTDEYAQRLYRRLSLQRNGVPCMTFRRLT